MLEQYKHQARANFMQNHTRAEVEKKVGDRWFFCAGPIGPDLRATHYGVSGQ